MSRKKKMSMEILFKIIITIAAIVILFFFLRWIWKSQIDIKATSYRIIKKFIPGTDTIATRDPNKIYQNGKAVGIVTGKIETQNDIVIFEELCETEELNQDIPFEYQRQKLQIIKIESITGLKVITSNEGSQTRKSVLSNVVCREIQ